MAVIPTFDSVRWVYNPMSGKGCLVKHDIKVKGLEIKILGIKKDLDVYQLPVSKTLARKPFRS